METAYPYDPIRNTREIRLLALNPAENEDRITGVLSHVCLSAEPEYEALSYTWDTDSSASGQQDLKVISCSGHEMLVKENLFAALRRLRYPDRSRSLWIDAICINQADTEEKNYQVALMGSIYANAREVVIWLGEKEADDALAFDTILRLERILENEPAGSDFVQQMFNSEGRPGDIPTVHGHEWRALWGLLGKRWFSRAWIVQEAALARDATLVCGDLILNFQRFGDVIGNFITSGLGINLFMQGSLRHGLSALYVITIIMHQRDLQEPLRLFDLLLFTYDLQATDPRDKIFSLLSFLDFSGNDTEHVKAKKPWSVDYNIPTDELFRKATAYCLLDEECFEILSFVNHGSRLDENGNTSWTLPRYIPQEYRVVPLGVSLQASLIVVKPIGRYPCDPSHLSHISISGVLVDQISAVSNVMEFSHESISVKEMCLDDSYQIHRYVSECEVIYSEFAENSSDDVPCRSADAFWQTLMCNTTEYGSMPGLEYGRSFSSWREFIRLMSEDKSAAVDNMSKKDLENLITEASPFENSFNTWILQRRFCTTDSKRLGMVPRAAQEGDIICTFLGAITPFVLRPDGSGNYRLVGECYVHGLMYGESFDLPGFMDKLEDIVLV